MEGLFIILVMMVAVLGPVAIIAFLISGVFKSLKRNPGDATKISIGMVVLMLAVVTVSIISILIIFQLFK